MPINYNQEKVTFSAFNHPIAFYWWSEVFYSNYFCPFIKRAKIVSVWNFPGFSSPVCCTIFFNFVWKSSAHICIFAKTKHSWMTQRKRWSQDLSLLPLYSFSYCIHVWIILCIVNDDDHFTLTINNNRKMHLYECLKIWKKSHFTTFIICFQLQSPKVQFCLNDVLCAKIKWDILEICKHCALLVSENQKSPKSPYQLYFCAMPTNWCSTKERTWYLF